MTNLTKLIKYISAAIFFAVTIVVFIASIFLFREFYKSPEITSESLVDEITSRIYDKNNNLVATIGNQHREFVNSDDIPQNVKDAVLSVEDSRFYSHIGLDPKRIIKAMLVNISAGSSLEGGSTITQQVVKTSLLTSKKSIERKIQEAFLSLKLESKYTKDDILEMYLNKIFYSDNQYGIRTASKYFYNKDLNELTIPQIALLAGIPQQPIVYNPYDNPEGAKIRRDTVLYAMYANDKISREDYEKYIEVPIQEGLIEKSKSDRQRQNISNPKYAAYVDLVVKEIRDNAVFENEQDPFSLGLSIYTNLDPELQEYVQNMLDTQHAPMIPHASQAAVTVLDTKNGLVEAIGGGKNYRYGGFNFAIDANVQGGSSVKPILDYGPGIEYYGWDPQYKFSDTPYLIAGTNFYIQNWDRQYHGNIDMHRSLAMSYNIPAVRAFEAVGFERSKLFASKLGITLTSEAPTSAIGGNIDTVSPIKMAGAFAAFGNEGMYNKPSGIVKVVDRYGNEIENIKTQPTRAMNASTAYLMTYMLKDVLTYNGTAPFGAIKGYDMAAKSGSSTFDQGVADLYGIDAVNATKDSWIIGYTTEHTVSVWQGADSVDSKDKALSAVNAKTTQIIMADIMKKAQKNNTPAPFKKPDTVQQTAGTYYATDRNTETDHMYTGTALDAAEQAKKVEQDRKNRSLASASSITQRILPNINSNSRNSVMSSQNKQRTTKQNTNTTNKKQQTKRP